MSRCEKGGNFAFLNHFERTRFKNHNKVLLTPFKTIKFQNTYILEVPGAAALPLLSCLSEKSSRFGSRRPPAALRCRNGDCVWSFLQLSASDKLTFTPTAPCEESAVQGWECTQSLTFSVKLTSFLSILNTAVIVVWTERVPCGWDKSKTATAVSLFYFFIFKPIFFFLDKKRWTNWCSDCLQLDLYREGPGKGLLINAQ